MGVHVRRRLRRQQAGLEQVDRAADLHQRLSERWGVLRHSPNNVSVSNGALNLTARRESGTFQCQYPGGSYETRYTSGMVSTYGRFSQTFGRFEIRAKFPAAKVAGLQSALWMWPVDPNKYGAWPGSGEIDIAEFYSQYPDRVIPYLHYDSAPSDTTLTNNYCMISDVSAFHSYVAEWTPTAITIKYDGQTCMSHASAMWATVRPAVHHGADPGLGAGLERSDRLDAVPRDHHGRLRTRLEVTVRARGAVEPRLLEPGDLVLWAPLGSCHASPMCSRPTAAGFAAA